MYIAGAGASLAAAPLLHQIAPGADGRPPLRSPSLDQTADIMGGRTAPMNDVQKVSVRRFRREPDAPVVAAAAVWGLGSCSSAVLPGGLRQPGTHPAPHCPSPPYGPPQETAGRHVPLEVVEGVKHDRRGILSMARHSDPNSGGSSFSILLGAAPHLDMQVCGGHNGAWKKRVVRVRFQWVRAPEEFQLVTVALRPGAAAVCSRSCCALCCPCCAHLEVLSNPWWHPAAAVHRFWGGDFWAGHAQQAGDPGDAQGGHLCDAAQQNRDPLHVHVSGIASPCGRAQCTSAVRTRMRDEPMQ